MQFITLYLELESIIYDDGKTACKLNSNIGTRSQVMLFTPYDPYKPPIYNIDL